MQKKVNKLEHFTWVIKDIDSKDAILACRNSDSDISVSETQISFKNLDKLFVGINVKMMYEKALSDGEVTEYAQLNESKYQVTATFFPLENAVIFFAMPCSLNGKEYEELAFEYQSIFENESICMWVLGKDEHGEIFVERTIKGFENLKSNINKTSKHYFYLKSKLQSYYESVFKTGKRCELKMFRMGSDYFNIKLEPVIIDNTIQKIVAIASNTTHEKMLIQENEDIALEYDRLFQTTINAMLILSVEDGKFVMERGNNAFYKIRSINMGAKLGKTVDEFYDFNEATRINIHLLECLETKAPLSYRFHSKLGYFNVFATPVVIKGKVKKIITTIVDETNDFERNLKIEYISYHDSLTGLYNRRYMDEHIHKLDLINEKEIAVVMLDIDGLKLINDTFGHFEGDRLIKNAAEIIQTVFEGCVVARWGGDEFVVIGIGKNYDFYKERIKKFDDIAFNIAGESVKLGISIGFSFSNEKTSEIYDIIKSAEAEMYNQKFLNNANLHNNYLELIKEMLFEKNYESKDHINNMVKIVTDFSEELELSRGDKNILILSATLHDIGKIGIDQQILSKPTKLTNDEYNEVKRHSVIGYRIALSSNVPKEAALCILHHHERFDGGGYPNKLKNDEIPLFSRIISIIDAYEVMTRGRIYQPACKKNDVISELERCAGTQFDPVLTQKFVNLIKTKY